MVIVKISKHMNGVLVTDRLLRTHYPDENQTILKSCLACVSAVPSFDASGNHHYCDGGRLHVEPKTIMALKQDVDQVTDIFE